MKLSRGPLGAVTVALGLVLCASLALAEGNAGESAKDTSATQSSALPGDEWSYGTYYIYPLTRHMDESDIPQTCRYALYPIAAVLDTVQLPFGALAGLFGE